MSASLYRMYAADGELLYVGATALGAGRFDAHKSSSAWWQRVARIEIEHLPGASRPEMHARERAAIAAESPRFNNYSNTRLRPTSGNVAKTHCPSGHAYTPENTYHYRGRRYCRACRDDRVREIRSSRAHVSALEQP